MPIVNKENLCIPQALKSNEILILVYQILAPEWISWYKLHYFNSIIVPICLDFVAG
jgi:hypothetical protein